MQLALVVSAAEPFLRQKIRYSIGPENIRLSALSGSSATPQRGNLRLQVELQVELQVSDLRQLQFPSAGGYGDALGVFLYWRGGLSLHAQEAEFSGNALDTRVGFWAQHLGAERDLSGRARAGARALARIHASRARALSRACAHGARSHALPRAHAPWPTLAHSHAHTPRSCSHSRAYLPLPTSRHRWASITYCRFAHLLDNRSLECWARHFPRFAEVIHAGGAKGPLSDSVLSCVGLAAPV